jgi:hypothetical protein
MKRASLRLALHAVLLCASPLCLAQEPQASPDQAPSANPGLAAKRAPKPRPALRRTAANLAAPAPVILPDPPTPVRQVRQIGLPQCVDVMNKMAHETLNRRYDVQSAWNHDAPGQHVFQSVAILNNPQSAPPDGLAALVATPTGGESCDGVALQVFPLAGDCQSVQKMMLANGSASTPILNARILFDRNGRRLFLLQGFANTCIAIAVDSTFGEPRR